jgi:ADP-heptose:LPS heptosyltransferase
METINILRHAAMGDVLYAEPVIRALAASKQYDRINFCTWRPYHPLFWNHPDLSSLVDSHIGPNEGVVREIKYTEVSLCLDWVYEHQWFSGNSIYVPLAYLKHANLKPPHPEHPLIYLTEEEKLMTRVILPKNERLLAIHPNGRHKFPEEQWSAILAGAKRMGFFTIGVGLDRSQRLEFDIDLRGKTGVRQLCAIIDASHFFITLESGPKVIADAFSKYGIALIFDNPCQSILKPNTNLRAVPCHNCPLDFLGLKKPEIHSQLNLHLKVDRVLEHLAEFSRMDLECCASSTQGQ